MQVISVEQDKPDIVLRVTLGSGDWVGFTAQDEPFQFSAIGRTSADKGTVNRGSLRSGAGTTVNLGERGRSRGGADER